ncbi:SWIM zinc finger domain-containing protein [Chloroflexota bacterium]
MTNKLPHLTETDIRVRCTETSFGRGRNYYTSGAIKNRIRHEASLEAHVEGTQTYRVSVWVKVDGQLGTHCNCPYAYGGDCKHIVATLLAWLNEPESFQAPVDLKAVLNKRSKPGLVDLLLDIFAVYPNLVDDLGVVTGPDDEDLAAKVANILADMQPWGHLSKDQVEAHLRLIARRAKRLAEQRQADLARRIYYALVRGCVNLCREYGSDDFFSPNIPYDFAVAYNDLAEEQVAEHGVTIKAEVEEMYRDVYDPDVLGLNEALSGTWCELMDHGLAKGEVYGV